MLSFVFNHLGHVKIHALNKPFELTLSIHESMETISDLIMIPVHYPTHGFDHAGPEHNDTILIG